MFSINIRVIPRYFFYWIPINYGAELIALIAIVNKASAFYALGALFTGHPLTVMEWVVNVITVLLLPLFVLGYYKVHNRRALGSLAYAHLYIIDTFMSLGFTVYFIVHWFAVGAKKANEVSTEGVGGTHPLSSMIAEATNAAATAAHGHATATAHHGGVAIATAAADAAANVAVRSAAEAARTLNKSATLGQELAVTIVLTTVVLVMRFYFMLVVIGFARILVQHANLRSQNGEPYGSFRAKLQWLLLAPLERFWTRHQAYTPVGHFKTDKAVLAD